MLVTSHSPDLLDSPSLTSDHLLAVRADSGTTVIERIDQVVATALHDALFTAGELLRSDQLLPRSSVAAEQLEMF